MIQSVGWHTTGVRYNLVTKQQQTLVKLLSRLDVRNLDFPDGTKENPQEHCHNKRRILMSPQECIIDWCTPNQLKMKHISPSLNP